MRDILDPVQGFDPLSPVSIARAVKRQLGRAERELGLLSAAGFLAKLRSLDELVGTSEKIPS